MQADLILLENRLKELDRKIAEINKRLPAHSVKPPIMTELFELEDERDAVAKQLEALKQSGDRFLIKGEQ
jgi:septal ring factor EnvC (AmiA/AmiB activator)